MMMKSYLVFFDLKVNGTLKEKCIRVGGNTKHDAIEAFRMIAPLNSIFRCVKTSA
jgi:hypothetical protein